MARKKRAARYPGTMHLQAISIPNCAAAEMRDKVNSIHFLAYHVETVSDGRKICITKPGGKSPFGRMKVDDFMVWIYDESNHDRWRISHEEIRLDVEEKLKANKQGGSAVVDLMHRVCKGEEPKDLTAEIASIIGLPGLSVELILKVYKWIWVQEDCNYPTGEGRWMSMKGILATRDAIIGKP